MTQVEITTNALLGFQNYLQQKYPAYADLQNELLAQIASQNLDSETEGLANSYILNQSPYQEFYLPNSSDALNETIVNSAFSGAAGYLQNDLSRFYSGVGNRIVANATPDKILSEAIDTTLVELASPANQNFPAVGKLGKALGVAGLAIGLGYAASEIYNSDAPLTEAAKQTLLLGTGALVAVGVAAALTPLFVGAVGGTAVAAVIGGVLGGTASYGVEAVWDNIATIVASAKTAGKTALEAADDVIASVHGTAMSFFDSTEQLAYDVVSKGQELLNNIMDGISETARDFPTWLSNYINSFSTMAHIVRDPLIVDLDGDGVAADIGALSALTTYFDVDQDGYAEAMRWTNGDDAFLVRDLNGNGRIDDTSEMFGVTSDGFTHLATHDANADGMVDALDAVWTDLLLWRDGNADGQTESCMAHANDNYERRTARRRVA